MPSRRGFRASARLPCGFPADASTAARSSVICRRRSSSACAIPRSARLSRAISSHARLAAMPDAQAAWRFLEQSDLIAVADEIQAAVRRVAGEVSERLGASYPLVLVVIGGSGLSKLGNMQVTDRKVARTPYGEPSGALTFGRIGEREVVFLARHGYGHTLAPHEVNYRANLWALKDAGVLEVVSVASVGAIRATLPPGSLVLPHQIINYTWGRHATYYEGQGVAVNHIDFTEPYSRALRAKI